MFNTLRLRHTHHLHRSNLFIDMTHLCAVCSARVRFVHFANHTTYICTVRVCLRNKRAIVARFYLKFAVQICFRSDFTPGPWVKIDTGGVKKSFVASMISDFVIWSFVYISPIGL